MTRKAIIVVLALTALSVAFAWASSYDDQDMDAHLWGYDSYVVTRGSDAALYATSLRGWVRAGVVRMNPGLERPPITGMSRGFWAGTVRNPLVRVDGRFGHRARLGGLIVTCDRRSSVARITAVAIPHHAVIVAFAAYPMIALVRGPLRRRRRRRLGLCLKCGYDRTGNESGTCPECGKELR